MSETLLFLAVLACPVGMGAMMWYMMRGNKSSAQPAPPRTTDAELTRLRAEVDQLRASERDAGQKPVLPSKPKDLP